MKSNIEHLLRNRVAKVEIDDDIYNALTEIDIAKILNTGELMKINKSVSYMSYILKDVCEYILLKTSNGAPLYNLRRIKVGINTIKSIIEKCF
jgi:hypothetical protein